MRHRLPLPRTALALGALLLISSCSSDESVTGMSASSSATCPVTITRQGTNPPVPPFSGPHARGYRLTNNGGLQVSITGTSCVKSGNITTCTGSTNGTVIPPSNSINGGVTFNVGAVGSGLVQLRVTLGSPCNTTLQGGPFPITIKEIN